MLFQAINADNKLIFDDALVIDAEFHANAPGIWAAGPLTKYNRRYFAESYTHKTCNSRQVGRILAKEVTKIFDLATREEGGGSDDGDGSGGAGGGGGGIGGGGGGDGPSPAKLPNGEMLGIGPNSPLVRKMALHTIPINVISIEQDKSKFRIYFGRFRADHSYLSLLHTM